MRILTERPDHLPTGIRNSTVLGIAFWLVLLGCIWAGQALATNPPDVPRGTATSESDASSTSDAESVSESSISAPQSVEHKETSIGVSMHSPYPAQVSDCYAPKPKLGRGWRFLFGAVEVSAMVELDQVCLAAKQAAAETELALIEAQTALIEAQNEQERLRLSRMQAEQELSEGK